MTNFRGSGWGDGTSWRGNALTRRGRQGPRRALYSLATWSHRRAFLPIVWRKLNPPDVLSMRQLDTDFHRVLGGRLVAHPHHYCLSRPSQSAVFNGQFRIQGHFVKRQNLRALLIDDRGTRVFLEGMPARILATDCNRDGDGQSRTPPVSCALGVGFSRFRRDPHSRGIIANR